MGTSLFSYSPKQAAAMRHALRQAGMQRDYDAAWPNFLKDITGRARQALAQRDGRPLYRGQAEKRFKRFIKALESLKYAYDALGDDLQLRMDAHLVQALLTPLDDQSIALLATIPQEYHAMAEQLLSSGRLRIVLNVMGDAAYLTGADLPKHQFQRLGPPKDRALHEFIHALMVLFLTITGKAPTVYPNAYNADGYEGTFFPFAKAVLEPTRLIPKKSLPGAIFAAYKANPWSRQLQSKRTSRPRSNKLSPRRSA